MENVSVYGATGFVGTEWMKRHPESFSIQRNWFFPSENANNILYLISTTDDYNFKAGRIFVDIKTNLEYLMGVLQSCKEEFGNDFIFNFVSSWFVYGKIDKLPAKEEYHCVVDRMGPYSATKLCAEQLVMSYCTEHKIPYRILRPANIIGIGDKSCSLKKNALQFLIREISQGRDVTIYDTPSFRDFINVKDVIRAIEFCMTKGELNTIYNLGNGIPKNVKELIYYAQDYARDFVDSRSLISEMPVPEFHNQIKVNTFWMDISKVESLGYRPLYSVEYTIRELVKYYKNNE